MSRLPALRRWPETLTPVLIAFAAACGGAPTQPADLSLAPNPAVTLQVDWRIDLVDNGFFLYAPTELARIAVAPDGRVTYAGTSDGRLVAVDAIDGRVLWEVEVGEPVDGGATVSNGELYFGAGDGRLHALDAAGGGELWSFDSGGNLDSVPAVARDHVLFANAVGTLVCLVRETGRVAWTIDDDDPVLRVTRGLHPPVKGQASPLVVGERVYVGFPSGRISAIDLETGVARWTTDLAGEAVRHTDVDEQPVWVEDRLLAASFSGGLYALDPQDGAVLWRQPLRGATRPAPYGSQLLTTTVDGRFVSLSLSDGQIHFSLQLDDRSPGPVHLVGDYAVVVTSQGALYVLDAAAPHIHARFSPDSGWASAAVAAPSRIIALDNQGMLYGLTLRLR